MEVILRAATSRHSLRRTGRPDQYPRRAALGSANPARGRAAWAAAQAARYGAAIGAWLPVPGTLALNAAGSKTWYAHYYNLSVPRLTLKFAVRQVHEIARTALAKQTSVASARYSGATAAETGAITVRFVETLRQRRE